MITGTVTLYYRGSGFSAAQLVVHLHERLIAAPALSDAQKSEVAAKLAVTEHCLLEGADEYLQMMALCTSIMATLASTA
jgi:replication factor C subunit 2/4